MWSVGRWSVVVRSVEGLPVSWWVVGRLLVVSDMSVVGSFETVSNKVFRTHIFCE